MKWLLFILGLGVFLQCRRDEIKPTPHKVRPGHTTVLVNSSLFGMAVDENGEALKQASVSIGTYTAKTDDKGFFLFKDILIDKAGASIVVNAQNHFKGIRVVQPDLNATSAILVRSVSKNSRHLGNLTSSQKGGVLSISGVTLEIPSEGIIDALGNKVADEVKVYIDRVDTEKKNNFIPSPGSFIGEDKDYVVKTLFPYGIIAVELERPNGEVLHFSNDISVKTRIPLPKTLVSSAPAFIPLWFFDVELAKWVQKGQATLNASGDAYEATIDATGFWSLQSVGEPVKFSARILDNKGMPNAYLRIDLIDNTLPILDGVVSTGVTNSNGEINAVIQANQTLTLKAFNECGQLINEKEIGPFPKGREANIGDYYLDQNPGSHPFSLSGTLYDCDWMPVVGGSVRLNNTLYPYSAITDDEGRFTLSGTLCNQDKYVEIEGFNPEGDVQTTSTFFLPDTNIQMGPLPLCNTLPDSFMAVRIDDQWYEMDDDFFQWSSGRDEFEWSGFSSKNISLTIKINDTSKGIGEYSVDDDDNINFRIEFDSNSSIGNSVKGEATIYIVHKDNTSIYGVIHQGLIKIKDFNSNLIRDTRVDVFFKLPLP